MGMNRKWNMKVFELHETQSIIIPPQNDDVYIDTSESEIRMYKFPFNKSDMIDENVNEEDILEISLSDLTKEDDFTSAITDLSNWNFKEGTASDITVSTIDNDTLMTFGSVVLAAYDLPTDAERWVFKFDLKINQTNYRSFFYLDGVSDTEQDVRYGYGIDIPRTGNPSLVEVQDTYLNGATSIEETRADEQYFTGEDYMPVILTRWDDTYTLYYDNRYMITIPTEDDTINRIAFYSWGGSQTIIRNPELYIIDNDSDATNIIISCNTNNDESGTTDNGEDNNNTVDVEISFVPSEYIGKVTELSYEEKPLAYKDYDVLQLTYASGTHIVGGTQTNPTTISLSPLKEYCLMRGEDTIIEYPWVIDSVKPFYVYNVNDGILTHAEQSFNDNQGSGGNEGSDNEGSGDNSGT